MDATTIANKAISIIGGTPLTNLATDTSRNATIVRKWYNPETVTPAYGALDEALRAHPWNFATARKRQSVTYTALSGGSAITQNGALIQVNSTAHGRSTGDRVFLGDVQGLTGANGHWYITKINDNSFTLDDSVFAGTYTASTGRWVLTPQFAYAFQHTPPAGCLRVLSIGDHGGQLEDDGRDFLFEGGYILTDCDTINLKYVQRVTNANLYPEDFINAFAVFLASLIAPDMKGNGSGTTDAQQLRQQFEAMLAPVVRARDASEQKGRRVPPFSDSQLIGSRYGGWVSGVGPYWP